VLEERRLSRAGRAHQVPGGDSASREPAAVPLREAIVLGEDLLLELDRPWLASGADFLYGFVSMVVVRMIVIVCVIVVMIVFVFVPVSMLVIVVMTMTMLVQRLADSRLGVTGAAACGTHLSSPRLP